MLISHAELEKLMSNGHKDQNQTGAVKMGKKKDKAKGKGKIPEIKKTPLISLDGVTDAKIVKTIEDWARQDSIPAGDYFYQFPQFQVKVRKSESAGRISWQLNGQQITRPNLYQMAKSGELRAEDKGKTEKKDKKKKEDQSGDDGPTTAETSKTYKKKLLINILIKNQLFKKKVIKNIKQAVPEKSITGAAFIAVLDDVTSKTTSIKVINVIFDKLKE